MPFPWLLLPILLLSLGTKLYRLGTPPDFYFDEVYHGFTATRYLHGDKDAYDPWAKPPEGRAFEWTHPPLAKLLMTGVMVVAGENSVGWRLGSVLFGTGAIALAAFLALQLFKSVPIALLTAFLMSIEGLTFAQSRIAMNDSYFIFFMLLTVFLYVRWKREPDRLAPLLGSGVAAGLALATKWTGAYLLMALALDLGAGLLWNGKLPKTRLLVPKLALAYVAIPPVVYLASYIHYFSLGYEWHQFEELQRQMWYYHTQLKATHSYQSKPWQWILNLRPVWMWVDYSEQGKIGNIYNLGNSVILISGLVAVGLTLFRDRAKTWERWFVLMCYFVFWLPWSFSPRIMLFYHYLPAVPFLCMILARWLAPLLIQKQDRLRRRLAFGLIASATLWFIVYYPHSVGIPVPRGFAEAVYLRLPGWR